MSKLIGLLKKWRKKTDSYLNRRPHRSFRNTKRRDYTRQLELPTYIKFTAYVLKTIKDHKNTFLLLALFYIVMTITMVGFASQDSYAFLQQTLDATGSGLLSGGFGEVGKAALLTFTAATGGISQNLTDVQQVYGVIIIIFTWLVSVWLLRNFLAGHKVKLRDGLYTAGSPIVSTFVVVLVFAVQLVPVGFGIIIYTAASMTGLLNNGAEAMLLWAVVAFLAVISVYWVTSTFIALVIITLPGMYPFKALKTAGDLVIGRRLRILYRILWMAGVVVVMWAFVMIPVIFFDSWLKSLWQAIDWLPLVPAVLLVLNAATIIFVSSYIYLLYRKVVEDDTKPA
ncbi:hypothetical protein HGB25_00780 [Candidatus Saccharibacteria bacterium]|nr:hypothetical protein [Candidatus Saccharibacteria bacterium]